MYGPLAFQDCEFNPTIYPSRRYYPNVKKKKLRVVLSVPFTMLGGFQEIYGKATTPAPFSWGGELEVDLRKDEDYEE